MMRRVLYICPVFCTVYRLRYLGSLIRPADPMYMLGRGGMLVYERDRHLEMRATLHHVETGEELMILSRARVIKAGHGGVLFGGVDLHFRGLKSSGEARAQSWWCVPMTKVVVPAPEKPGFAGSNNQGES